MQLAQEIRGTAQLPNAAGNAILNREQLAMAESDIVARLRADAKIQSIVRATLEDAADEIVRLRAALIYVAGLPGADPLTGQLAVTAARAALKGANLAEKS
jgi:hypothetical protein